MKLEINPDKLVKEVQHDFNEYFPFLKIEFFANGNGSHQSSLTKKRIAGASRVTEAGKQVSSGTVDLKHSMTVAELENKLRDEFGLAIQVFRKSGNIWLETTMTDSWTLGQQNEHGKEISAVPLKTSNIADLERED